MILSHDEEHINVCKVRIVYILKKWPIKERNLMH